MERNRNVFVKKMAGSIGDKTNIMAKKSMETLDKTKEAVLQTLDVNGDGQIDIEDIILMAFKVPGVSVNRESFLKKNYL